MNQKEIKRIREIREDDAVSPVIATILMVAITVVLAGTLYAWASSLAESNTGDNIELYSFSSRDAAGSPSTATDDNLAVVTMDQGESTSWASLAVSVSVDSTASVKCANPGQTNGNCIVVETDTSRTKTAQHSLSLACMPETYRKAFHVKKGIIKEREKEKAI